ncbi:SGNH/GDSL hydrolase family protein [Benzoatithermus flavus]|uniref:SGNH/GDSL hydrolase family protein n=1 Tax=Benzoatithermus flavus TaxID=3108223 RepID=A0ABU8XT75_9PROT
MSTHPPRPHRHVLLASTALILLAMTDVAHAAADGVLPPALAGTAALPDEAAGLRVNATGGAAGGTATPVPVSPTYGLAVDPKLSIPRITSFGDSYSKLRRYVQDPATGKWVLVRNFLDQSLDEGKAGALAGYAVSGATAANVAVNGKKNSFAQQVDRWIAAGGTLGSKEATTVFFGYNDIDKFSDLTRSQTDYVNGVKRLIGRGANTGDRKLFLFLVHDWGKNPAQKGDPDGVYRARTRAWNSAVAAFASNWKRKNVVAVDLFTTFENVFASPSTYGLANVTTVDLANSKTTALYADPDHFGEKGQDIIQQVFLSYASRAWGYDAVATTGSQTTTQLGQDIDQGLALGIDALPEAQRLGFNAFTVGELGSDDAGNGAVADRDPSRAGFAEAFFPDQQPDGGLGVNYAFSPDTSLGVVIGRYGERTSADLERASVAASVVSDSVSMYLDHKTHGFSLRTRLTVSDDHHVKSEHDDLTDTTSQARFSGRTTEVAQRAGYTLSFGGVTWTPWMELSRRVQALDSFTIDNPYISDVTYSATEAGETLARIGLDAVSDALSFGDGASLKLFGGIAYTQSLSRDDYRVTISEAAGLVPDSEERIERGQLRQIGFNLGGQVALGERLSLGAGLGLGHDLDQGSEQELMFRLNYRFF